MKRLLHALLVFAALAGVASQTSASECPGGGVGEFKLRLEAIDGDPNAPEMCLIDFPYKGVAVFPCDAQAIFEEEIYERGR